MNPANKTLVVITPALLTFEMQAVRWERTPTVTSPGHERHAIKVFRAQEPAGDVVQLVLMAEFSDIHAVFFKDEATLVTDDDE
jgi:hypothetical protein